MCVWYNTTPDVCFAYYANYLSWISNHHTPKQFLSSPKFSIALEINIGPGDSWNESLQLPFPPWFVLVLLKFGQFSSELTKTGSSGATECGVWIGNCNVKVWKCTQHKLHKIWRSLEFCGNSGKRAHPWRNIKSSGKCNFSKVSDCNGGLWEIFFVFGLFVVVLFN